MTGDAPNYRMPAGLGVIEHRSRIVVYQMSGNQILWARPLGEDELEITPELAAAIEADRSRPS